jgi:peptide chain release factor 1
MSMFAKLDQVEERFEALNQQLSQPDVAADVNRYRELMREYKHLREVVDAYRACKGLQEELEGAREMLGEADDELKEMAREEISGLEPQLEERELALKLLLLPQDPNEGRDVILEIRSGAGGDEAGLWAGDLFRMYTKYGEGRRWKIDVMNTSFNSAGGFKEVIASISGADAWTRLRYESGVHRVQRVPSTETQGRIHTSTCTVALMPEADEVEIDIADNELRVDVFRASGPGGQSVNTTDSAVRLTHIPTGLVVQCQDEKSQHKNKAKALKVLRARLYDKQMAELQAEQRDMRMAQVGTGDRAEKIRTYNFPQSRITDHRIGLTRHNLTQMMEGDLDEVIDACTTWFQAEVLRAVEEHGA